MQNLEETLPMIVHLWCGPRSLSTCTMYSFAQRPDTLVFDEPLYSHWLQQNPSMYRPYREELLNASPLNGNEVLRTIASITKPNKSVLFLKHISRQVIGIDRSILYAKNCKHVFLVRDPLDMIMSWEVKSSVHQEECSLDSMGLPLMVDLFSNIRKYTGKKPIIVDSNMLKENPKLILTELCNALQIPFFEEQLSWKEGPKPEIDG